MHRIVARALPVLAVTAFAWIGYSYSLGTPKQVALRTATAFFENDARTVFRNGLQSDLVNPSYSPAVLSAFISIASFPREKVERIEEVTPESLTHKGFRITTRSGVQYSVNLVKTAHGWRFNDLSFLLTQVRKRSQVDTRVFHQFADVMQREGVPALYQPEGRRISTVADVRGGIKWEFSDRRKFKWE